MPPGSIRFPVRPSVPLEFLLWDGTEPTDSYALGNGLLTMRWGNLLHDCSSTEEFLTTGARNHPRCFMPAGLHGTDYSNVLWQRGLFEFPRKFFDPHHNNTGNNRPNILAFSGHGIPGYMFSESGILMCSPQPMAGSYNNWRYIIDPVWNNPATKVVILSACRQLSGKPNQYYWSRTMRSVNPVHMILGYRNTAPSAATSARINGAFLRNLRVGQPFVQGWKNAHSGSALQNRWAALCYTSSINDRIDEWMRVGRLTSSPNISGEIKYFDSDNINGRVVLPHRKYFNCWLTPVGRPEKVPPWSILRPNSQVDLHIELIPPTSATFDVGDTLWIGCLQVRPDYAGVGEPAPYFDFNINRVFTLINNPNAEPSGSMAAAGRLHDRNAGWTSLHHDVYIIRINNSPRWTSINSSRTHLTIPIRLGSQFNSHLQVFYFMIMLRKLSSGHNFGIHTRTIGSEEIAEQDSLVDDDQFAVFNLGNS